MVLIKLRLKVPFQDLAFRFMVSLSTVSRIFSKWINVMYCRLHHFGQVEISLAEISSVEISRNQLIDCFEMFNERPTNLLARAQTSPSYKHHNTIKLLIGITPQGSISIYIKGMGSDKYLTENCSFLDNVTPRSWLWHITITENVGLKLAKLVIPAFTKSKSQINALKAAPFLSTRLLYHFVLC